MSEILERNMYDFVDKVTNLKKRFNVEKEEQQNARNIINEMRIIHGKALITDFYEKQNIITKGINNITNDDYVKISFSESLLYLIHCHIKECESVAFPAKKIKLIHYLMSTNILTNRTITSRTITNRILTNHIQNPLPEQLILLKI